MKATNAYIVKRALFDHLITIPPFVGASPVQLQYARNDRDLEYRAVYGGGSRFVQSEEAAEGPIRYETVTTGLYVRTVTPGLDVRASDVEAEVIADLIATSLIAHPDLGGGLTFEQIVGGSCDFWPTADESVETILSMTLRIESHLT